MCFEVWISNAMQLTAVHPFIPMAISGVSINFISPEGSRPASFFDVNPSLPRQDWIGRPAPAEEVLAHPSTDNTSPHHLDIAIYIKIKILKPYPATRRAYLTYMYNAFGALLAAITIDRRRVY
ncbi:hypothetical protein TWF106_003012 [Orbilia oligospora]|uniref:Uncharacterized protein n=1 Tax=Orbilia oligospora TaxID=2813651 RepID=A0A6G1LZT2_ORBOL|nr:hypothetical protein TWF191_009341 [Orbilia oligospora]KAF3223049.1 hypothetical protein TWF679_004247 [Orbilia oligospora]KAF3225134.1 hypothetical protein TWF106_003012 [Orbilia oligospora]KAF3240381.1 hypothetical protein TWF192_009475 [Orbilia oligospora]